MVRILGLDPGEKRIGVALSDELGLTAQGLCVIESRGKDEDIAAVRALVEEYSVTEIVVGLPVHLDGREGEGAKRSRKLVQELEGCGGVKAVAWDERLSTLQAQRHLIGANVSRKRRRQVVDKVAASLILQNYLDWRGHQQGAADVSDST